MEEVKNDKESKVKSFRVDEDTFEKFKKIAGEEFGNQGQCLSALINLYETETSKVAIVERKLEIESFQEYLNKINTLFLTSLQLNQDAEGRIRDEFARQLNSKDKVIEDLHEKVKTLIQENKSLQDTVRDTKNKCNELEKLNNSIIKDKHTMEELVNKNDELLDKNKEEIASMAALVNEYKGYKEINNRLLSKIEDLKQLHQEDLNNIKVKELESNSFDKQINTLEYRVTELKEEIKKEKINTEALRKEHKIEIEQLEIKLENRFTKELEKISNSYNEKLELEKRSKEISNKELVTDKKELTMEITRLTEKIKELKKTKKSLSR